MSAIGIEFTDREADRFYWPAPSSHGESAAYLELGDQIERLHARYIHLCDIEPMPVDELNALDKEISRLELLKWHLWDQEHKGEMK